MDSGELTQLIQELEDRVERLRALYEQYFMGLERIEPLTLRKEVDRRLWVLRREQIRNTGTRFKLQTVVQRYNTYQQYWQRIVREIETGTYQRDLGRAAQRFGEAATTALGRRRQKMFEKGQARRVERDAQRRGQSSIPPGATPSTAPRSSPSADPGALPARAGDPSREATNDFYEDVAIDDGEMFHAPEPVAQPTTRSSLPVPKVPPRPGSAPASPPLRPGPSSAHPTAARALAPAARVPLPQAGSTGGALPRATRSAAIGVPARTSIPGASGAAPSAVLSTPGTALPSAASMSSALPRTAAATTASAPAPRAAALGSPPAMGKPAPVSVASPAKPVPGAMAAGGAPSIAAPLKAVAERAAPAPASLAAAPAAAKLPLTGAVTSSGAAAAKIVAPATAAATAKPGPLPTPGAAAAKPSPTAPARLVAAAAPPFTAAAAPQRPAASGNVAVGPPPAAAVAAHDELGLSSARLRQLYGAYVDAKRQANESTAAITYDKVAANLRQTAKQLREKHHGREVDFEVVMKNGKPVLKPVLKS